MPAGHLEQSQRALAISSHTLELVAREEPVQCGAPLFPSHPDDAPRERDSPSRTNGDERTC